jgi:hypothetical protein
MRLHLQLILQGRWTPRAHTHARARAHTHTHTHTHTYIYIYIYIYICVCVCARTSWVSFSIIGFEILGDRIQKAAFRSLLSSAFHIAKGIAFVSNHKRTDLASRVLVLLIPNWSTGQRICCSYFHRLARNDILKQQPTPCVIVLSLMVKHSV